jgi:hypothetical protein
MWPAQSGGTKAEAGKFDSAIFLANTLFVDRAYDDGVSGLIRLSRFRTLKTVLEIEIPG